MRTARARSQGDDICMIVCRDSAHQGVRAQVAAVPDAVFYMLLSHGLARHSIRSIAAFRRLRSPRLELKIEDAAPENLNSMRMWWWWEETLISTCQMQPQLCRRACQAYDSTRWW